MKQLPYLLALSVALLPSAALAERGHLLIVGGGLRSDNIPVYSRFVSLAGGAQKANVVIVPTASSGLGSSNHFKADLEALGLAPEHVTILNVTAKNAAEQAGAAQTVETINQASAVWFVGGDQVRLYKGFTGPQGQDTPALKAIKALYFERGGVIGGTSAGASIQGQQMPSAFGVPMDTLDFGVASQPDMRGVYISPGFGFFAGIIDQHFNTFDGRPVRMATYLIDRKLDTGYGLDENTAMHVTPDGKLEVLGELGLTIMDTRAATRVDGPLGVRIGNVLLSRLESGDRYDPATHTATINTKKAQIKPGDEYGNGNRLITDLSQTDAYTRALTLGLADNTAAQQQGLYLRYNGTYSYGYRVTLSKTPATMGFYGNVNGVDGYAVLGARMDVEPVTSGLQAPAAPADIQSNLKAATLSAVAFRGLLPTRDGLFMPQQGVTRAELAQALVFTSAASLKSAPKLSDVPAGDPAASAIAIAVSRGWLDAPEGRFGAAQPVTRGEAAAALVKAYDYAQLGIPQPTAQPIADLASTPEALREPLKVAVAAGLLALDDKTQINPSSPLTREALALALAKIAGLKY